MEIKPVPAVSAPQKSEKVRRKKTHPEQRQARNPPEQDEQQGHAHIDEIV